MGTTYRNTWLWNVGFSAYWFAVSYKWFILLFVLLPLQVRAVVPGGVQNSSWGLVYGLGACWAIVGPAIFGHLSDRTRGRWGHRAPYIAAGALLTLPALFVLLNAPNLAMFALGYLLLQVADDVGTGPYGGMVPEVVPEEHRGRASSVMTCLQRLAEVASAVAALVLADTGKIYAAIAVVTIVGAGSTLITIGVRERTPRVLPPSPSFADVWIAPWRSPDFRWVWFTRALSALAFALVTSYLVNYLTDAFTSYTILGVDFKDAKGAANILAVSVSLSAALGAVVASRLADRIGRKRLIYFSGLFIATALFPFALTRDLTLIWLLALPFGFGFGLYASADWALAADVMPDKNATGAQMGLWTSSMTAVQVLTGAAGFGVDALNAQSPNLGYMVLIWAAALFFILGTVLVRQIRGSR